MEGRRNYFFMKGLWVSDALVPEIFFAMVRASATIFRVEPEASRALMRRVVSFWRD